jgi:hypothetical protein
MLGLLLIRGSKKGNGLKFGVTVLLDMEPISG